MKKFYLLAILLVAQTCYGQFASFADQAFLAQGVLNSHDPTTSSWVTRVVANGGATPSAATQTAADTFWKAVKAAGLDSKIITLNFVAPDSIIAALTPYIVGGGNDPWIPWVSGGSLPFTTVSANGLVGGTLKILDPGFNPSTCFTSDGDAGITFYVYNNTSDSVSVFGGRVGGSSFLCFNQFPGFGFFFECWGTSGNCPDRVTNAGQGSYQGLLCLNRTSTSAAAAYKLDSGISVTTIASCSTTTATTRPNFTITLMGQNDGAGATSQTVSFFDLHHGMTSGEASTYMPLVQQLRVDLGGGYR